MNLSNGNAVEVLPPVNARLMACKGTSRVTRADLALIDTPASTDTFQTVPHKTFIDEVEKSLQYRRIRIIKDDYAVSNDGMKMFALLVLNADHEGVQFAIGLRTANDKSMSLAMTAGYQVTVCSNMMFTGEFKPLSAKHTKHFDLIESVSLGIDRIQRGFEPLRSQIDAKRTTELSETEAMTVVYKAFMQYKFPVTLMKTVHKEFFVAPSYDQFKPSTLWSLENAFTTAFKQLQPVRQFEMTARLGKFMRVCTAPF